jgi:hypothetical protein
MESTLLKKIRNRLIAVFVAMAGFFRQRGRFGPLGGCLMVSLWVVFNCGCANVRVTDPPKTATEQFLLSRAAIQAVEALSFDSLFGRNIFVDSSHCASDNKEFLLGEFRARLMTSGVNVVNKLEECEIVVELRSGGLGIDRYENLVGIPAFVAPTSTGVAAVEGTSTLITPELAITKNIKQVAFASVAYVAYWREGSEVVSQSGPALGTSYRDDWWFLGIGPTSIGSIPPVKHEVEELE